MRRSLNRARGVSMIEVVVTMTIAALLAVVAAPPLADYLKNSRLREAGNVLLADALFAQSEALKRNGAVRLTIASGKVTVEDVSEAAPVNLRTSELNGAVLADALVVRFGANGMTLPFGTAAASDFALTGATCSNDIRCPGLRIDAGGAIRLCPNKLDCA